MFVASIMPAVAGTILGLLSLVGAVVGQRRVARGRAYLSSKRLEEDFKRPRQEWDLL
jgi:hypothetical protein